MNPAERHNVRPFKIDVPEAKVQAIRSALAAAHRGYAPDDDENWKYGTEAAWFHDFVDYWIQDYDWSVAQERLNRWPQYKTTIDGLDIHFYHVKGSGPRRALILSHGWPGSVLEFQDVIERLAFPERSGGRAEDAFDLIIPSLPGYAFSARPKTPIGPRKIAELWRSLMVDRLGYQRFSAQGGDWGAAITTWLGADHADVVDAIHLNMIASWIATGAEASSGADLAYRERLTQVQKREAGYSIVQATKPQTIGLALAASPYSFAAWVIEKFWAWADIQGGIESRFSKELLASNLMLYLLNDAVISSLWLYRGRADEELMGMYGRLKVTVPTGVALFPAEFIPYPPKEVVNKYYNVTRWTEMKSGGHFAALEEPAAFSSEVRSFLLENI